jgi:biopolymer transport protein ExbD
MAMKLGSAGVKSDINVTPFVDIVLVLLIIFMVVTPMLSRALDISVPPKSDVPATPDMPTADQLIISVKGPDTSPKVFLNRDEIPGGKDGVKKTIEDLMKGRRGNERVVFFQADNDLNYQYVVEIMDEIRAGGADKIGLITDESMDVTTGAQ